jgi:hypothetical protein
MEFLKKEKLKSTDSLLLMVYLDLSIIVFTILFSFKTEYNQQILTGYNVITLSSIYGVFCRGLRHVAANIIWLAISGIHMFLYYLLKDDPILVPKIGGTVAGPLFYTWLPVLTLQFSRFISLKFFRKELVTIFAYGTPLFGNAKPKTSDWVLVIPNFAAFLFALMAS